ncbi:hypothetical protein ACFLS1_04590 [Verrucomicrobiota bacterium]
MKLMKLLSITVFMLFVAVFIAGCAMMPGGIAASTTPIEGRKYSKLGRVVETDSRIYLFGFIPITGANLIRDAVDEAVESRGGDAMINVTVESYVQWWVILTRFVTRVDGEVIRFEK